MPETQTVMSNKLLYISYLFPPSGSVGSPRAANFTKYLAPSVDQLFVIAPRKPSTPVLDPALLAKIPREAQVHRVWNPEVSYSFRDRIWKRLSPLGVKDPLAKTSRAARATPLRPLKWLVREVIQQV